MIEKFQEWYQNRHKYQKNGREKTGKKTVGFSSTYAPEGISYAFDEKAVETGIDIFLESVDLKETRVTGRTHPEAWRAACSYVTRRFIL